MFFDSTSNQRGSLKTNKTDYMYPHDKTTTSDGRRITIVKSENVISLSKAKKMGDNVRKLLNL